MSVFILETDAATSAASSIGSLATEVANISSSVNGYDTSCEDGFNFAGAKGVIAGNIEACSVKMQNTTKIIESVVSGHTELQNSLKFQDPTSKDKTDTGSDNSSGNGNKSGSGSRTGGGEYSGSYSGGGGYYDDGGGAEPTQPEEEKKESKKGLITAILSQIGYAFADESNLSAESKALLKDKMFKYDENGYAMIGNRYVIACDSSIANVGDVIRFTQKDGNVVECVVGITTVSEKYKNVINFIVDKNAKSIKANSVTKTLLTNSIKIENIGTLDEVRSSDLNLLLQQTLTGGTGAANTGTESTNTGVGDTNAEVDPTAVVSTNTENMTSSSNSTTTVTGTGTTSDGNTQTVVIISDRTAEAGNSDGTTNA